MSRILLLGSFRHLGNDLEADIVVPLFWAAPETLLKLQERTRAKVLSLAQLVPDVAEIQREAYETCHRIAITCPTYRGVLPLLGQETVLAELLLPRVVATHVISGLQTTGETGDLVVAGSRRWATAITEAAAEVGWVGRVTITKQGEGDPPGLPGRMMAAALNAFSERDWRRFIAQPVAHFGPRFHRARPTRLPKDEVWCYASYINYSRAISRHAVEGARWLVNGRSAALGTPDRVTPTHLWDVGSLRSRAEHVSAAMDVLAHVEEHWPETRPPDLRPMLLSDLAEIDLFTQFVERAVPSALWVGNQWGGEGALIQVAWMAGVPVTQVQHGALDPHFRWADLATDRFLVWGEAWRSRLPASSRKKTFIDDPGVPLIRQGRGDKRPTLLFISAPVAQPMWDPVVAREEVASVLRGFANSGGRIVARIHPMDDLRPWRASLDAAGAGPERFDKRAPLGASLRGSTVALTYRSTVFMDCIANRVPVVAMGWYPWAWDDAVRQFGGIILAPSVEEAQRACNAPATTRLDVTPWLAGRS